MGIPGISRDDELGAAYFLAAEQVSDGFDRLELEVEIGFEVKFHRAFGVQLSRYTHIFIFAYVALIG